MLTIKRALLVPSLVALITCGGLAPLSPVSADDKIVAKVNGHAITETDLKLAETEIGNDLGTLPLEQRRRVLVEYLVESLLFAEAAEKEKLGKGQAFDERMRYWQRRALRDTYFEQSVKGGVSDADAKSFYDKEVAGAPALEEVHARHILVDSEEQAKEIAQKLAKGEDFAGLAKQFSKDTGSKEEGGDLGFFTRGRMVPQFEEAAFKLAKGETSQPIKSQFGWHLIKVEDKRQRAAPPFDKIKDRIVAALIQRRAQEIGQSLRATANVEFTDPVLKAQVEDETKIKPLVAPQKK